MRRITPLLLAVLVAGAGADDLALLRRGLEAEAKQPRVGRQRIEVYPTETAVVSEVSVAWDGAGHARREHLSGPSRGLVVIVDAAVEWYRAPGSQIWVRQLSVRRGDVDLRTELINRLAANYEVTSSTGGAVAGRQTRRLDLTPKRDGNPSRRLWLDTASGLTLRSEVRNYRGELTQRWAYTGLGLQAPTPASLRLPVGAQKQETPPAGGLVQVASLDELERRLGHAILRAGSLPPGYAALDCFLRSCREGGWEPVTTYSDGLNVLTLLETGGRGRGRGRRWRGGRCQIQPSRLQVVVRISADGREAVIIGDHAPAGLEAMAQSLR